MIHVWLDISRNWERKVLTVLCLSLASATAMGIGVYVDSFSVHQWDEWTSAPFSMRITDLHSEDTISSIREIEEVEAAASIALVESDKIIDGQIRFKTVGGVGSNYTQAFPDVFMIEKGRYPQNTSEIALEKETAQSMKASLGEMVNYSIGEGRAEKYYLLEVVGVFKLTTSVFFLRHTEALVVPEQLPSVEASFEVHIDINREPISPYDAHGSLAYVERVEKKIRALLPSGTNLQGSLGGGIGRYIHWREFMRRDQLLDSTGFLFITVFLNFLAIRYNLSSRESDMRRLQARGASEIETDKMLLREVGVLMTIGVLLGFVIGILLSRVAICSLSYFHFDLALFFSEPFLITLESFGFSLFVGLFIPFLGLGGYFLIQLVEEPLDAKEGKVGRIVRILRRIRWDVVLLILSSLTLLTLYSMGADILENTHLSLILSVTPLLLFAAISSLVVKAIRQGSGRISMWFEGISGRFPTSIGIRRLGREASSGAAVVVVLALAVSLAWNMSVVNASLPRTRRNHSRFVFGSDISFHLDENNLQDWPSFIDNVTSHYGVKQTSLVSKLEVHLSNDEERKTSFVALNPAEYAQIGYDYRGILLNQSKPMNELLQSLGSSTAGGIITEYLANKYDFSIGDVVKVSRETPLNQEVFSFSVIGVVSALSTLAKETPSEEYGWPFHQFGKRAIWINREIFGPGLNLSIAAENVLCCRMEVNSNSTEIIDELIKRGAYAAIEKDGWVAVSREVDKYVNAARYAIGRGVETMVTVSMVLIIAAVFAVHASENVRSRKREMALLRAIGGNTSEIVMVQAAELLVLALFSMILLLLYSPLFIMNNLLTHAESITDFPVRVFVVIPWPAVLSILAFFFACVFLVIGILGAGSTRINLSESLNANWAEAGPCREDF